MNEPFTDQKEWQSVARMMLLELSKCIPKMSEMTVDQLKTFTETMQNAYWFAYNAETWDKQLEEKSRGWS